MKTETPNTETQHTPGPWFMGCSTNLGGIQIITINPKTEEPNGLIATINTQHTIEPGKDISDEVRANARLIAAAPELLEALNHALEVIQLAKQYFPKDIRHSDRFNLLNIEANSVRPAIAKAIGQPVSPP